MAQATNTNAPSYIVVNSQEGQNPQVSTHGTMAAAAKEFKRALREDVYYGRTLVTKIDMSVLSDRPDQDQSDKALAAL